MGWLYGTVLLFSALGALAGFLFRQTLIAVGAGLVTGALIGLRISLSSLARLMFPDSFIEYANETESVVTHVLELHLWTTETNQSWVRLNVTAEEWRSAAVSVYQSGVFSTNTINRAVYDKIKKRFEDIGLIETGGKGGGYVLTRSGSNLFKLLATLPFPYPEEPDAMKMLEYPTQTNTQTQLREEME